jgi:hypothetical protein
VAVVLVLIAQALWLAAIVALFVVLLVLMARAAR